MILFRPLETGLLTFYFKPTTMTIWQQGMIVVPSVWGILPTPNKEANFRYEDSWRLLRIDHRSYIEQIDFCIPRASWVNAEDYFYWKGNGDKKEDNDLTLCIDPDSGIIISMAFRLDLRSQSNPFINSIFDLCAENEWHLESLAGKVYPPDVSIIPEVLEKSHWHSFINNPETYVANLYDKPSDQQP